LAGTNGGVTFLGLVFSLLGGAVVGLGFYLSVIYFVDSSVVAAAPPQWPLILVGAFGGFVGSVIDSILGATLQYSGEQELFKSFFGKRKGTIFKHSVISLHQLGLRFHLCLVF